MEQLTPGGALFEEMQMWWEDLPSHPNLTFIRWGQAGRAGQGRAGLGRFSRAAGADSRAERG